MNLYLIVFPGEAAASLPVHIITVLWWLPKRGCSLQLQKATVLPELDVTVVISSFRIPNDAIS